MSARQPPVLGPALGNVLHGEAAAAKTGGTFYLVTCEHGGKRVPAAYRALFVGRDALLASHRGHDPGALVLAREMAAALGAPLVAATISRLVVDLNRSPGHRGRFSEVTRVLSQDEQTAIHARYYQPYRRRVERIVAQAIRRGARVVHVSSHSFTPVMDGRVRNADVGFLYDPGRHGEVALAGRWMQALQSREPSLRLRRNYPYTGRSDGFCAWLRRHYGADSYVGIELEVNQRHATAGGPRWIALREELVAALRQAVGGHRVVSTAAPGSDIGDAGASRPNPLRAAHTSTA